MRVTILVGSLAAGGAEQVAVHVANFLSDNGSTVEVLTVGPGTILARQLSPQIRLVPLNAGRARRAILRFRRYVKTEQPDAVLAIAGEMNLLAAIALIGMKRKPLLLLSVHASLDPLFEASPPIWRAAAKIGSRIFYGQADWVVAASRGVAEDIVRYGWAERARVRTIYNPVLPADFLQQAQLSSGIDWLEDKTVPTIAAVGRLSPEKNYPLLLEAFRLVRERRPVRLIIAGEGDCRLALEKLVAEAGLENAVRLVGYVTNPYAVIRAADVLALSSVYEGFGNVLVEALAVGTPVVATDCPHGPREILEGGKWGRLVPPGDPDALAAAMVEALDDPLGSGVERANEFTVERGARQYLELIESALRQAG